MTTIPIISSEIPPELDGNHIVPEEAKFDAFEHVQLMAIERFAEVVKSEAQKLYDEDRRRIYDQEFRLAFSHILYRLASGEKK